MRTGGFIIMFAAIIDFIQGGLGLSVLALQLLPIVGQMAAALAGAVATVLSFILGTALIVALVFTGLFSWSAVLGGSLVESIPLLNMFIPGWTLMAWRCVHLRKEQERKKLQNQEPAVVVTIQTGSPRAFDGIRAANDSISYEQAAA